MSVIYDRAADTVRWIYDRRIQGPAVLNDAQYFPQAAQFTSRWRAIRNEALAVARGLSEVPLFHELMRAQEDISDHDGRDWRVFVLKAYGTEIPRNLKRCPETALLVKNCPSVLSASFSFLAPGKHIPAHRGPFRGIVRFHLGLSMPRDGNGRVAAVLTVDGVEHRLADGDMLLWDDTYTHEVLNASDEVRIALLLDIWRQGMPADMVALSNLIVAGARMAAYLSPHR